MFGSSGNWNQVETLIQIPTNDMKGVYEKENLHLSFLYPSLPPPESLAAIIF